MSRHFTQFVQAMSRVTEPICTFRTGNPDAPLIIWLKVSVAVMVSPRPKVSPDAGLFVVSPVMVGAWAAA